LDGISSVEDDDNVEEEVVLVLFEAILCNNFLYSEYSSILLVVDTIGICFATGKVNPYVCNNCPSDKFPYEA